jgi:quinol monooxygenase YgiN
MAVKIVALLTARPGKLPELEALLATLQAASRAESGNLRWDIWRDQANADRLVLDELYVDQSGVAAHRETPHFKAYLAAINDLAERTALVLDAVAVG